MKKHNFSAGPSILSSEVFDEASKSVLNLDNIGLSLIEISHRSKEFVKIMEEARELSVGQLGLSKDDYTSLFLQGGASTQFLMVAYNFLNQNAGYINTGSWSVKAMKEAKLFGNVHELASSDDKNFNYIATKLGEHGISISESRTVSDSEEEIINAINELRKRFKYVFTTGGIGPTHDDVTAASIAKAFNVKLEVNNEAYKILEDYYNNLGTEFNDIRQRMARIPKGAKLIKNPISAAPGFNIENVYVFAGIPKVMQSMLDETLKGIEKKDRINKSLSLIHI